MPERAGPRPRLALRETNFHLNRSRVSGHGCNSVGTAAWPRTLSGLCGVCANRVCGGPFEPAGCTAHRHRGRQPSGQPPRRRRSLAAIAAVTTTTRISEAIQVSTASRFSGAAGFAGFAQCEPPSHEIEIWSGQTHHSRHPHRPSVGRRTLPRDATLVEIMLNPL